MVFKATAKARTTLRPTLWGGYAARHPAATVQARYDRLIAAWSKRCDRAGALEAAVDHFLKVTASYAPGLFHRYGVPDLPRTNNDLEHLFGSHRHHERRTTGRKGASPSLVLRGSVRVVAATATRITPFTARDLAADPPRWLKLRRALEAQPPSPRLRDALSPQPGRLPRRPRTPRLSATLADLVFL